MFSSDESKKKGKVAEPAAGGGVRPARLAEAIALHLETLILEGSLRAGDRLLPERDLAAKLEVSRPSLREALDLLECRGLLVGGRSGARIASLLGETFDAPLEQLIKGRPEATTAYLEFRGGVESASAYFAALRATEIDRRSITLRFEDMKEAYFEGDLSAEALADSRFHLALCETSHNLLILHVMSSLSARFHRTILSGHEKLNPYKDVREVLLEQHRTIADAIIGGDADTARQATLAHISFTRDALRGIDPAHQSHESRHWDTEETVPGGDVRMNGSCPSKDAVPLAALFKAHPETALDYLEFRFIVAGLAAERAAVNASAEERERIADAFRTIETQLGENDADAECAADRNFHLQIYAASHNALITCVMNVVFGFLHRDVFYDRAYFRSLDGARDYLFRQHKSIFDAIMAKDPVRARDAAEKHVNYIRDGLIEGRAMERRTLLAERRRRRAELASNPDQMY